MININRRVIKRSNTFVKLALNLFEDEMNHLTDKELSDLKKELEILSNKHMRSEDDNAYKQYKEVLRKYKVIGEEQ
ncbi:hypothetical protein H5404_17925 [Vibrio parahaemolyticus]|uniref:hypothetical protein n=1 Tax=Vibrio parahaemolyticus TaxID=670 RepID=UPI0016283B5A|nr:hypothetical protein [Vibrio parahaemolyticus]QNE57700.1 hypothetical protein H5404_17925 [Vibrio parahaemolyticus]